MSPFSLESSGSEQHLRLSGEVTVEHARALHAALVAVVTPETTLRIDAREVTRLDAAAIQVLLAASRASTHTETVEASPAWAHAFQRFGISNPTFSASARSS